jgi:hypothetical protein
MGATIGDLFRPYLRAADERERRHAELLRADAACREALESEERSGGE